MSKRKKAAKKDQAFVYVQRCADNGRYYVGYHKGKEDDGYFCSSRSFELWRDHDKGLRFDRSILFRGTKEECKQAEIDFLSSCYLDRACYNMANADGKFFIRSKLVGFEVATKRLIEADEIIPEYSAPEFLWYTKEVYADLGYRGIKQDIADSKTTIGRIKLALRQMVRHL